MSAGTLFVVATPLGNLGDVSDRARATLSSVRWVAAEDTRRTKTLLNHVGAHPRLMSFHAHSSRSRVERILAILTAGDSVALVSDAGTPTISDPGAELVREVRVAGFPVVTIPGPSAVAAALSISGMPADRYIFLGFLTRRGKERERLLAIATESAVTVVMFESPQRTASLLDDLLERCGPTRIAAVAREMTKVHEELNSGTLAELASRFRDTPARGEVTVLLSAATTSEDEQASVDRTEEIRERARALLTEGATRRDVAQIVARELQVSRNEAYRMVMAL